MSSSALETLIGCALVYIIFGTYDAKNVTYVNGIVFVDFYSQYLIEAVKANEDDQNDP